MASSSNSLLTSKGHISNSVSSSGSSSRVIVMSAP